MVDVEPCSYCGSRVRLVSRRREHDLADHELPPAERVCTNRQCESNGPDTPLGMAP